MALRIVSIHIVRIMGIILLVLADRMAIVLLLRWYPVVMLLVMQLFLSWSRVVIIPRIVVTVRSVLPDAGHV
jgi:hypothetical protein